MRKCTNFVLNSEELLIISSVLSRMDLSLQKKRWRPEIAPPDEEVITEGQKQLKNLLDKQLQKDVTIQQ